MKIAILTGAGISAESGIKTFRDADGLWEGHDVMEVASPQGWNNNQNLVMDFYNQRRAQLIKVDPNAAHYAITKLQEKFEVHVITQNVDDLHERAGNRDVLHLHGELFKVRCLACDTVYEWKRELHSVDLCSCGSPMRPHIVWFGEAVPMLEPAIRKIAQCDLAIIIGTSMQVYPAASLTSYLPTASKIIYIDPKPSINHELGNAAERLEIIASNATTGVPLMVDRLLAE